MTKTISERLKAIKAALEYAKIQQNGELKYDYQQPIDYITAIQATLSSAESDEKSVLEKWYANKVMRVEELEPLITTALLAQREKYDALIAKAEGDAGKLLNKICGLVKQRKNGGIEIDVDVIQELLTAELLKAGQREWFDISTAPKDGTNIMLYANVGNSLIPKNTVTVGHYCHGWWNNSYPSITLSNPTHWQPLPYTPSSQEG